MERPRMYIFGKFFGEGREEEERAEDPSQCEKQTKGSRVDDTLMRRFFFKFPRQSWLSAMFGKHSLFSSPSRWKCEGERAARLVFRAWNIISTSQAWAFHSISPPQPITLGFKRAPRNLVGATHLFFVNMGMFCAQCISSFTHFTF